MGFIDAIGSGFAGYFTFSGRASRSEYWWWTLFVVLGSIVHSAVSSAVLQPWQGADLEAMTLTSLAGIVAVGAAFSVLTFIPSLAVTVRRLHDIGRSGVWVFIPWLLNGVILLGALMSMPGDYAVVASNIGLEQNGAIGTAIMIAGGLASAVIGIRMFFWLFKPGTRGDNFFGPNPLGSDDAYVRDYVTSNIPAHARPGAAAASHKDEIRALYQSRVLGKTG